MRLDQPIDVMGKFWLPEQSKEDGVIGHLTIEDGGDIRLKLFESFKNFDASNFFNEDIKFNVVGIIKTNFDVTLQGCFITSCILNTSIGDDIVLSADLALLDHHTSHMAPFKINQMRFKLEGLETWLHGQDFNIKKNFEIEPQSVTWGKEQNIYLGEFSGFKIELVLKANWAHDAKTVIVEKLPFLKITSIKPDNVSKFISVAHNLNSFFSFACNNITTINNVLVYFDENGYQKATQTYYKSNLSVEKMPNFKINNFLFSYDLVQGRLVSILHNYFLLCREIEAGLTLYHSTQIHKRFLLESEFLAIAQALENVARYKRGGYKNTTQFKLEDELTNLLTPIEVIIGKWTNYVELIRNIVETRHYYTHNGIDIKPNTQFGYDVYTLMLQTQSIFKLIVLYELGFSLTEIEDIIANNYLLRQQLK
ncbi:HEPN domain-containing protein [Bartonella sp. HY038]|uniref:ApeA N-terminal domain 1-containing protein n=1 Tax=Bartonella sp. HY038 TaxID=2759660 RepID=UPI0015FD4C53|nr:HEPN domain-containing protein [Bartonella sp. HY038]